LRAGNHRRTLIGTVSQAVEVKPQADETAVQAAFRLDGARLIPIDAIRPNRLSPRQLIDERALDDLARSIRRWGQLQPIVVRRVEAGYELICGERRWRAHARAGIAAIWAIERGASDQDALLLALVENFHRADLSHAEKVAALDQLAETVNARGLRRTANELRLDPSWLSRKLAVRRDPIIFPALDAGRLSFGQAAELLRAPASARQMLLDRVLRLQPPVATAAIRAWVEDVRDASAEQSVHACGRKSPGKSGDARDTFPASYDGLLAQIESLGDPGSMRERSVLLKVIERARELLASSGQHQERHECDWVELRCLMCGELAGVVEGGRQLRPASVMSVRRSGKRLACGRCGGTLTPGARGVSYRY
jgi:ParB/RepB/Spo0J family partition protein